MNTTTPEKCPKCGSKFFREETDDWGEKVISYARFICETTVYTKSKELRLQGHFCLLKERDQLAKRVKRLEEAGDALIDAIQSVQCWNETHVGECINQFESWRGSQ